MIGGKKNDVVISSFNCLICVRYGSDLGVCTDDHDFEVQAGSVVMFGFSR